MKHFDIAIAKKYAFIKNCPEHQIVTLLESNGCDPSPAFGYQLLSPGAFLFCCLEAGEVQLDQLSGNIWKGLANACGVTNEEGDSGRFPEGLEGAIRFHGLPLMTSCDSYELDYSNHYLTKHIGTRVVILEAEGEGKRYLLGEAPFQLAAWVDRSVLLKAHQGQQTGRGYYHVPRLPKDPVGRTVYEIAEDHAKLLREVQERGGEELQVLVRLEILDGLRASIQQVNECVLHIQAGWLKLRQFYRWLYDQTGHEPFREPMEAVDPLVRDWQRFQMECVKIVRRPVADGAGIRTVLNHILDQEASWLRASGRTLQQFLGEARTL
ncbi:hypothetical protein [Paenibacillus wynnii]|uniref:Butirosin biosynthesis protein H N-terminal domain-containing protein n=1 Tax=Paenibacillus wynnii TaxID=268407 RepID=A0A098MCI6_9BACL|nr:hypothetical protein [Paenibacillus wynnii]KGE19741.1 hypothetical protein PWYN_10620 [Paenibacillus wynnii]